MDITSISQDVSVNLNQSVPAAPASALTVVETAQIMRSMLSSIDLEELTLAYFDILTKKLPCIATKLSFADQILRTGKNLSLIHISEPTRPY